MDKHGVHVSPFLDAGGNHASSGCPSSAAYVSKRHTFISRVVVQAALDAGLNVRVEPDTYNLLLGELSKADCRRIFPKAASREYLDRFNAVLNALEVVSSPACLISDASKAAYVQARIGQLPILAKNELKGLRIDVALEDPTTGQTKWVDVSAMHTTCPSYVNAEMKAIGQSLNVSNIAEAFALPDYLRQRPNPSLLKKEIGKVASTPG